MFIDRVCVLGTAVGAWECFNLLFSARLSLYSIKVSSPSYSVLSFFANQEKGIMLVASPHPCIMASASSSVSEEAITSLYPALRNKRGLAGGIFPPIR